MDHQHAELATIVLSTLQYSTLTVTALKWCIAVHPTTETMEL
jgi:hypothetical protein